MPGKRTVPSKERIIEMDSAEEATTGVRLLSCMEPPRQPVMQEIIKSQDLPKGSRGLDVGCGIGLQALLLAQAMGPNGHVVIPS